MLGNATASTRTVGMFWYCGIIVTKQGYIYEKLRADTF
jgi:hypothetical protein